MPDQPPSEPGPGPRPAGGEGGGPGWGIGAAIPALVVSLLLNLGGGNGEVDPEVTLPGIAFGLAVLWLLYLTNAFLVVRRQGSGDAVADLGLVARVRDLGIGAGAALITTFVLIPAIYALLQVVGLMDADDLDRLSEPADRVGEVATDPASWAVLAVLVGIGAPLVEEIYFRGLLQPAVIARTSPAAGVVITGALFGLAHWGQVLQFPALAAFGVVLGALAWRYRRLGPAVAAHVVFNLVTLVQLFPS